MHYFAYGSNLDPEQMAERCPSAAFLHRALLEDFELAFTRWSTRRRCGVADVVARPGSRVWGVVYALSEDEGRTLDGFEGYAPGRADNWYARVEQTVAIDGDPTRPLAVATYEVVERAHEPYAPSGAYLGHLLRGAAHWGLPDGYRERLRAIATAEDAA
ncbi:MAG: gamma-glutamylcyclotransferase family protein [Trueperaceae bacterium]